MACRSYGLVRSSLDLDVEGSAPGASAPIRVATARRTGRGVGGPAAPTGFAAAQDGANVNLRWDAATDGVTVAHEARVGDERTDGVRIAAGAAGTNLAREGVEVDRGTPAMKPMPSGFREVVLVSWWQPVVGAPVA